MATRAETGVYPEDLEGRDPDEVLAECLQRPNTTFIVLERKVEHNMLFIRVGCEGSLFYLPESQWIELCKEYDIHSTRIEEKIVTATS